MILFDFILFHSILLTKKPSQTDLELSSFSLSPLPRLQKNRSCCFWTADCGERGPGSGAPVQAEDDQDDDHRLCDLLAVLGAAEHANRGGRSERKHLASQVGLIAFESKILH